MTSTDRTKEYLEMARQIAEGKRDFISFDYPRSPITQDDYDNLTVFAGEVIFFDDPGFRPSAETRNERVVFLCFAAAARA